MSDTPLSEHKRNELVSMASEAGITDPHKLKKDELVEALTKLEAKKEAEKPLTPEEKTAAFEGVLEENPEARILPIEGFVILYPEGAAQTASNAFTISAFSESGTGFDADPVTGRNQSTVMNEWTPRGRQPAGTSSARDEQRAAGLPLNAVPSWARAQVYDLVVAGTLFVASDEPDPEPVYTSLLDTEAEPLGSEYSNKNSAGGLLSDEQLRLGRKTTYQSAEQDAAFAVLNKVVNGQDPIPSDREVDPRNALSNEIERVLSRIRQCIDAPQTFTNRRTPPFSVRVFLSHLFRFEYAGETPPRKPSQRVGGTRPQVLVRMRQMAQNLGYEVVGDHVTQIIESEIPDLTPEGGWGDTALSAPPYKPYAS